ncbi:MAG: EI24 domain-containing protein [Pseudomonadota bacterium]
MTLVFSAFIKACGQLFDPPMLRVLAKTLLVTLLIFVALALALWLAIAQGLEWALTGFLPQDYEGPAVAVATLLISLILFWLLFRVVALAVLQFFADEVVAAVEARHYPDAAERATPLPLQVEIALSLRGAARALVLNGLALPVALFLMVTAIGPAVVFLFVNAVLLGRELTDMAWLRHCEGDVKGNPVPRLERFALGAGVAGLMMVPFANLVAPLIGAAAGTHLVQGRLTRQSRENAIGEHERA